MLIDIHAHMYKYPYQDDPEPIEKVDAEDRLIKKIKLIVAIIGTAAAVVLVICMFYTYILHNL